MIQINADCTEILYTSSTPLTSPTALALSVTYNGTEYTDTTLGSIIGNTITILPTLVSQVDEFSDGIYTVDIVVTLASTDVVKEKRCVFASCGLCDNLVSGCYDTDKFLALVFSNDCAQCDCADAQVIYDSLSTSSNSCNSC